MSIIPGDRVELSIRAVLDGVPGQLAHGCTAARHPSHATSIPAIPDYYAEEERHRCQIDHAVLPSYAKRITVLSVACSGAAMTLWCRNSNRSKTSTDIDQKT
jgi:hypothetical protein